MFCILYYSKQPLVALITALHTNILSMSFMKWFSKILLAVFCGPSPPKPSRLGLGQMTVEVRPSDAAFHHSPSWSNSPYTGWRCVWGHCHVGKINDQLNPLGWRFAAVCILTQEGAAMLILCALHTGINVGNNTFVFIGSSNPQRFSAEV